MAIPDWITRLDGANLVIGIVTLVAGLLGLAYLMVAFVTTPVPPSAEEPAEPSPYPSVDRLVVPLLLPIGVALVIALIIFLTSQILLVVPEAIATPIALGIALFILVVCGIVATAPRVPRGFLYAVVGLPLLALVIAGGAAGLHRQDEAAKAEEARANAPQTAPTEVTTDNKFSKNSLAVPAGQEITLTQTNKGVAIHNWHVLDVKDVSGKDITTDLTQAGQSSKVTFTVASAGSYKFQCDVHPTEMIGTLKVQ